MPQSFSNPLLPRSQLPLPPTDQSTPSGSADGRQRGTLAFGIPVSLLYPQCFSPQLAHPALSAATSERCAARRAPLAGLRHLLLRTSPLGCSGWSERTRGAPHWVAVAMEEEVAARFLPAW